MVYSLSTIIIDNWVIEIMCNCNAQKLLNCNQTNS